MQVLFYFKDTKISSILEMTLWTMTDEEERKSKESV